MDSMTSRSQISITGSIVPRATRFPAAHHKVTMTTKPKSHPTIQKFPSVPHCRYRWLDLIHWFHVTNTNNNKKSCHIVHWQYFPCFYSFRGLFFALCCWMSGMPDLAMASELTHCTQEQRHPFLPVRIWTAQSRLNNTDKIAYQHAHPHTYDLSARLSQISKMSMRLTCMPLIAVKLTTWLTYTIFQPDQVLWFH